MSTMNSLTIIIILNGYLFIFTFINNDINNDDIQLRFAVTFYVEMDVLFRRQNLLYGLKLIACTSIRLKLLKPNCLHAI